MVFFLKPLCCPPDEDAVILSPHHTFYEKEYIETNVDETCFVSTHETFLIAHLKGFVRLKILIVTLGEVG